MKVGINSVAGSVESVESVRALHEVDPSHAPCTLTMKTKMKAKSHLEDQHWIYAFNTLGLGDIDSLKRLLGNRRSHNAQRSVFFGSLSIIFFVISNEIHWGYIIPDIGNCQPFWNTSSVAAATLLLISQCLVTITTVILLYCIYIHGKVQYDLAVLDRRVSPMTTLFKSSRGMQTIIEFILCAAHVPPGLYYCFDTDLEYQTDLRAEYCVQILNMVLTVRVYLLFRFVSYNNRFSTQRANVVLKLYAQRSSPLLAFKDFLQDGMRGIGFFAIAYFSGLFVFGYGIMCFERGAGHEQRGDSYAPTFVTCLWFCWTVITTIGFGDWVTLSPLGRWTAIVLGAYGTIISAFVVSYAYSLLELRPRERKVVSSLNYLDQQFRLKNLAAYVIQHWWISRRTSQTNVAVHARLTVTLAAWRDNLADFREMKSPDPDLEDISNQILEVQLNVAELAKIIMTLTGNSQSVSPNLMRSMSSRKLITPKNSMPTSVRGLAHANLASGDWVNNPPVNQPAPYNDSAIRKELAEIRALLSTIVRRQMAGQSIIVASNQPNSQSPVAFPPSSGQSPVPFPPPTGTPWSAAARPRKQQAMELPTEETLGLQRFPSQYGFNLHPDGVDSKPVLVPLDKTASGQVASSHVVVTPTVEDTILGRTAALRNAAIRSEPPAESPQVKATGELVWG